MTPSSNDNSPNEQLFEQVVADYLASCEAGTKPDEDALLVQYPMIQSSLREFFAGDALLWNMLGQLKPQTLALPTVPGYDIIREIARGGVCVVYEARWHAGNRLVALKMLMPDKASNENIARICQEYAIMRSLRHAAIVPVLVLSKQPLFYTMRLMEGSLAQGLSDYKDNPKYAAQMLIEIATAIDYAHCPSQQSGRTKVLHRDLKPSNILFDESQHAYLADFGFAKAMTIPLELTQSHEIVGTVAYMSPEQTYAKDQVQLTDAIDVHGLGAILYAMLTGRPPFQGATRDDTLRQVREIMPERPSRTNPAVPAALEDICMRCLAKDPRDRYASARALIEDLNNFLFGKPIERSFAPAKEMQEVVIALLKLRVRNPDTLNPFRVGSVEIPVTRLVGGDGETRYSYPDGIICAPKPMHFSLPAEIEQIKNDWLSTRIDAARRRGAVFEDKPMVRIDDYRPGLSLVNDRPWPLHIAVSRTRFFDAQLTNGSIDEQLPSGKTIREAYASDPDDFLGSRLANPICTNLSLVTADQFIYVAQRSTKVATNPGGWAPAVSGTGNPILDVINPESGQYSPFQQARREAYEEATAPYLPDLSEITFFGLARTLHYYYPFLFGELRIRLTARELDSQLPGDSWETRGLLRIPFTVEAVTDWITAEYGRLMRREIPGGGVYTAILSLLQSLAYEYPNDWQEVIHRLTFDPADTKPG